MEYIHLSKGSLMAQYKGVRHMPCPKHSIEKLLIKHYLTFVPQPFRRNQIFHIYNQKKYRTQVGDNFHQSLLKFKNSMFRCIHILSVLCNGKKFLQQIFHIRYLLIFDDLCLDYFLTDDIIRLLIH